MPTKILAIDDSKTVRLAIKITFAAEDADVTSVGSGADAVARAKQLGADVVLLDANLAAGEPGGLEVCRQLKGDSGTSSIPVIMMVSNQSPTPASDVDDAGADATLTKPFDTQELIDMVAAVQGKPARAASASATPAPKPPVTATPVAAAPPPPARVSTPPAVAASRAAAKPPVGRAVARPAAPASPPMAASPPKAGRVGGVTEIGMPSPHKSDGDAAPASARAVPAGLTPPTRVEVGAAIPIAIPIPFTAASAPTSGMLERLQKAAGDSGLDPKVAEALVKLSREVIEQIVWEVVPDLAESIIKQASDASRQSA